MRARPLLTMLMLPAAVAAQQATATVNTELRASPTGRVLATVRAGAPLQVLATDGAWSHVALDGWLHTSVVGPTRDTFALSVAADGGAFLRGSAERDGAVIAHLEAGMALSRLGEAGEWRRVRRTGWVATRALRVVAIAAAKPELAPVATADSMPGDFGIARHTLLTTAPDGRTVGALDSAARVHTLSRERGWARVELHAWVREADLVPVDTSISDVSAADLRADPDRFRGRTVRWIVQKIAFQTADPLRKDLAPDEPYLLARGPASENSLLYLALPATLVESGRALKPLASVVVLARIRTGRSDPSGVPILDVLSIAQR